MSKKRQQQHSLEPWLAKLKEKGSTPPVPKKEDMELGDDFGAIWARIEQTLDAKAELSTTPLHTKGSEPNRSPFRSKSAHIVAFRQYMSVAAAALLLVGLGVTFFTLSNRTGNKLLKEPLITSVNTESGDIEQANPSTEKLTDNAIQKQNTPTIVASVSAKGSEDVIASYKVDSSEALYNIRCNPTDSDNRSLPVKTQPIFHMEEGIRTEQILLEDLRTIEIPPTKKEENAVVTVELPPIPHADGNSPKKELSREFFALENLSIASHTTYSAGRTSQNPNSGLVLKSNTNSRFSAYAPDNDSPLLYDKAIFKHHFPINTGVVVALAFGKRFSFESGVHYTLLRSTVSNYFPNKTLVQRVHYIGIPLGFNFEIYRYKGLSLYSGTGFAIDKAVASILGDRNLGMLPWQFSISGHAGISYNVAPAISIYLEPGMSYYFDDNSSLKTYYRKMPLHFSISMGIRFTPFNR